MLSFRELESQGENNYLGYKGREQPLRDDPSPDPHRGLWRTDKSSLYCELTKLSFNYMLYQTHIYISGFSGRQSFITN